MTIRQLTTFEPKSLWDRLRARLLELVIGRWVVVANVHVRLREPSDTAIVVARSKVSILFTHNIIDYRVHFEPRVEAELRDDVRDAEGGSVA